MPICVPIKELKNTGAFAKTVEEADGPVIVTRNGYEEFAVMTMEQYEALRLEAARAALYREVELAEADIRDGRMTDGWESLAAARERYGL